MTRLLLAIVAAILGCAPSRADVVPAPVLVVPLAGAIGPASADFVGRSLSRAADEHAQLVVLEIDTPGGLDRAMRQIIQDILASPVPVAAFVAPSGARAASAGTYILYASHVAAMAPGTNLGAATPVSIGLPSPSPAPGAPAPKPADAGKHDKTEGAPPGDEGTMTKKAVHDAAAYIRSLAQLRGRNAEWAERAVRESVSLSADEALAQHVIDLTARDVPELVAKLNGRKLVTAGGERILATSGAMTTTMAPDWRTRFLAIITDPSVALMLLMAGIYGLFFEFWNPGLALPGVLGAICLLLGLFALQMLPVNYAGLALVLLGIGFIVAETFLPAYGSLGVGGARVRRAVLVDRDAGRAHCAVRLLRRRRGAQGAATPDRDRPRAADRQHRRRAGRHGDRRLGAHPQRAMARQKPGADQARPARARDVAQRSAIVGIARHGSRSRSLSMAIGVGFGTIVIIVILVILMAFRVLREYQRAVVFMLGRFWKVKGPGFFLLVPVIQQMVRIDLRTVVMDVPPQDVITRDNVSVKVNAVVYFRIVDPAKAVIQVENYYQATSQLAQTTLRAVLGKHELDELLSAREKLNLDIQQVLDSQTEAWGIKVSTVEMKDVDLNESMIRAIARQAEAERERRAKIIHAEGELQASEKLLQAAQMLSKQPQAMQLRYLQTLANIAGDKSSTIVFPLPIDLLSAMASKRTEPAAP